MLNYFVCYANFFIILIFSVFLYCLFYVSIIFYFVSEEYNFIYLRL